METQRMGKSWRLHGRMVIPVIMRLNCDPFDVTFHLCSKKPLVMTDKLPWWISKASLQIYQV